MKESLLEDKYKIVRTLGSGGMSTVYLAENIRLGTLWAIKKINKQGGADTDLLVEPNILKKLNHPALPRIFDIFEDQDSIYIVEDYIEGTALDRELARVGSFSEAAVLQWTIQICEVLEYLHSFRPNPIIYRDMKPANIILSPDGKLKLVDFGIAREYKSNAEHDTTYIGTRGYAAPEQYGYGQSSVTTDIYSLGVTMFHLLTGRSPVQAMFELKPVRTYKKALSEEIERIICRCTKHDPHQRYQSASELKKELRNVLGIDAEHGNIGNGNEAAVQTGLHSAGTIAFRKQILAVHDNLEFASELAYTAAKLTHIRILLINLDCLSAPAESYLSLSLPSYTPERNQAGQTDYSEGTSLHEMPQQFLSAYSRMSRDYENLQVLSDCFETEEGDVHLNGCMDKLLDYSYRSFDLTLINIPAGWGKICSTGVIQRCDSIMLPLRATLDELRRCNILVTYFIRHCSLDLQKICWVAYEYKKGIHLAPGDIAASLEGGHFLGCIDYSSRREVYRNLKALYCRRMDLCMTNEYSDILAWFGITEASSLGKRIGLWASNIYRAFRIRKKKTREISNGG